MCAHWRRLLPICSQSPLLGSLVIVEFTGRVLHLTFDLTVDERLPIATAAPQFLRSQRMAAHKLGCKSSISDLFPPHPAACLLLYMDMRCPDSRGTRSQRWSGITRLLCAAGAARGVTLKRLSFARSDYLRADSVRVRPCS